MMSRTTKEEEISMNKAYKRLLELKDRVSRKEDVLCLLGLGSMSEMSRMDKYSDMDFFLIVEKGSKKQYLESLDWLEVTPFIFKFKNSADGYKVLYEDEVFAEFAVFEPDEIVKAGFTKGNIVYYRADFDVSLVEPKNAPKSKVINVEYNINEALANLYIGLLREHRGEHASAFTFIQVYAPNLIIEILPHVFESTDVLIDPYVFERRIEERYHGVESILTGMKQGYKLNKESASFTVEFIHKHFTINQEMYQKVKTLATST